jgi:hypothetical protein
MRGQEGKIKLITEYIGLHRDDLVKGESYFVLCGTECAFIADFLGFIDHYATDDALWSNGAVTTGLGWRAWPADHDFTKLGDENWYYNHAKNLQRRLVNDGKV